MEAYTFKDQKDLWAVAAAVITVVLLMYLYRETTGLVIFLAVCGFVMILGFLVVSYTVTVTQDGIICKNLFRPMTATWSDVVSVSVVCVTQGWYICITRKDKLDVLVPYSKELKTAIVTCRGFLDRDDMAKNQ